MLRRADGRADESSDGRRPRLDFDGARARRHVDVELLGTVQQQWQSLLPSCGWLAADWAAHAAHRSPSVPEPNRRDVSALRRTRSRRGRLHACTHTPSCTHIATGARTHACMRLLESESTDSRAPRLVCFWLRCVGCHHRLLSDNLLNGTLPDSLTGLTRLKRLYAPPFAHSSPRRVQARDTALCAAGR